MSTSARRSFIELSFALTLLALSGCGGGEPEPIVDTHAEPIEVAEVAEADEGEGEDVEIVQEPEEEADEGEVGSAGTVLPPNGTAGDEPGTAEPGKARDELADLAALVSGFEGPAPSRADLGRVSKDPGAGLIALTRDEGRPMAVRAGATRALGVVANEASMARIGQLLAGSEPVLRRAAVQASDAHLGKDAALASKVVTLMSDEDTGVARAAVLALGDLPSARKDIESLAAGELPTPVRTAVNEVLGVPGTAKSGGATPLATPPRDGKGRGR